MALYLIHAVFKDRHHDYTHFADTLRGLSAHPVTEHAWLIESEAPLDPLMRAMFGDRPPADRFLTVEIADHAKWSAANLEGDMAAWLKARRP